jgi:hypothetical protein
MQFFLPSASPVKLVLIGGAFLLINANLSRGDLPTR